MFSDIDFSPGRVTHNDFNIRIWSNFDVEDDSLKEDMFKVNYPKNYILDIGWYSGINKFIVYIVKDCDWDNPIQKIKCNDLKELINSVKKSADYLRSVLEEK